MAWRRVCVSLQEFDLVLEPESEMYLEILKDSEGSLKLLTKNMMSCNS